MSFCQPQFPSIIHFGCHFQSIPSSFNTLESLSATFAIAAHAAYGNAVVPVLVDMVEQCPRPDTSIIVSTTLFLSSCSAHAAVQRTVDPVVTAAW
jgi:hypothetical protein